MGINKSALDKELIASALNSVESHLKKEKDTLALEIIQAQLLWLRDFAEGKTLTSSKLKDIELGQLAMREVETLDMPLAEQLYEIQSVVKSIR